MADGAGAQTDLDDVGDFDDVFEQYDLDRSEVREALEGADSEETKRRVVLALAFVKAGLSPSQGKSLLADEDLDGGEKLAMGVAMADGSLEATGQRLLAMSERRGAGGTSVDWLNDRLAGILGEWDGDDATADDAGADAGEGFAVDPGDLDDSVEGLVATLRRQPSVSRRAREDRKLRSFPEVERLEDVDDEFDRPGVLLADRILEYQDRWDLIYDFEPDNLRPAGYKLRVGDEYSMYGETHELSDSPGNNEIQIPPFEVVVIKTAELVNMPRFLIGRLNIKVDMAHEGLLWVGGPQVDPGYVGHLYCPIYNLSARDVRLSKGQGFGVIDFIPTTERVVDDWESHDHLEPYPRPPDNLTFDDYEGAELRSGLSTEAKERVDAVEQEVERVSQLLLASLGAVFTVLAILIAALSVFLSQGGGENAGPIVVEDPLAFLGLVLVPAGVLIGLTVLFRR